MRYLRERERMFPAGGESKAEVEGEDGNAKEEELGKKQKVYVLDGGFVQWQEKYGKDKRFTDAYDEEMWKYGY